MARAGSSPRPLVRSGQSLPRRGVHRPASLPEPGRTSPGHQPWRFEAAPLRETARSSLRGRAAGGHTSERRLRGGAPGVAVDRPAVEELLQELERRHAPLALRDDEFRPDLPAEPKRRTPVDVDAEAAFAVDETGDPALKPEPFLLIICTRHVVTILPAEADGTSSAGYSDVPAYGQLHPPHRCDGGQRLSMSP